MEMRRLRSVTLPLAGVVLLGGCATYRTRAPSIVYVPAPCGAPGALRAVPVAALAGAPPASPADGVAAAPPAPVAGTANGSLPADERCLVAVVGRGGYYGGGYPYRYGYPGYYGAPFYGSLGLGFGIGGRHYRGGHFGGGHFGGGHGRAHGGGHH